jgi:glucan biosynthesis protein C
MQQRREGSPQSRCLAVAILERVYSTVANMATEQKFFAWQAWAWVVAALVVASAIQVSLSYCYEGSVSDLITSYLIVLATGVMYGPLVWNKTPVTQPQSYLPVKSASARDGKHGAQEEGLQQQAPGCATEFRDEDIDAGGGATLIKIEGARLKAEHQARLKSERHRTELSARFDTESLAHIQSQNTDRPPRLHFLDNIKIFLTASVVSFHVNCAFGGCDSDWYLVIGDYSCFFQTFTKAFRLIHQAYFMSLFFFISAYFTPASYDRKGRTTFLRDKGRRLWLPAMVATFTIVPGSLVIGWVSIGTSPLYVPFPGHCWFLFWLLALNFAYCFIRKGDNLDSDTATDIGAPGSRSSDVLRQFPTSFRRYLYGALVCGLATFGVCAIFDGVLLAMPIDIGSLPSDLLLFGAGVFAFNNQWISKPIAEQMYASVWVLRVGALLEAVALLVLESVLSKGGVVVSLLFYLVAGFFCLDVSLAILEVFQRHLNLQTPFSRFLADSAYTVYLIHPLVTTIVTSGYIWVYNSRFDHDVITFVGTVPVSSSHLEGPLDGSVHLAIGWVAVNVVSHAILWPLAWGLRQLPGLRSIL